MNVFSIRLKELRKENGLLQRELGEKINLPQNRICQWEKGIVEPNIEQLTQTAKIFNVSVDYLLGNADDFGNIQQPEQKEELAPSERELLEMYRGLSPEGKEKVLEYTDMVKGDEERKKVPHGGIFGKQRA